MIVSLLKFESASKIMTKGEKSRSKALSVLEFFNFRDRSLRMITTVLKSCLVNEWE